MKNSTDYRKDARRRIKARRASLRKDLAELKGAERRTDAMARVLETLPKKIKSRANVEINIYGSYVYAIVRPAFERFTDNDTLLITDWCASNSKFEFAKRVNSGSGTWYHELKRWIGYSYYNIEFATISNIDGCELIETETTEVVKRYEVKC
jgi:hypothetical protein